MRKNIITLFFSIIVGIPFVFFARSSLFQKVTGYRCDGFGCIGLDFVLFVIGIVLIPLVFGVLGFAFSKENRLKQAFFSLGISLITMLLLWWNI